MRKGDEHDPKGLIYESFRIDGIGDAECRTIFLDWALSLPLGQDPKVSLSALIERYAPENPGHPMLPVMTEGLSRMDAPRRRGGARSRSRS